MAAKARCGHPQLFVDEPTSNNHLQSIIVLHGRGSNGTRFGNLLLRTVLPNGQTLRQRLPNARFIFPTASFKRSTIFKRKCITQWFDNYSLENPSLKEELQIDGLLETFDFVSTLVQQEMSVVGSQGVVLGGLSQGCAAILTTLLLWNGPKLKGVFGLSGWLPFFSTLNYTSENYSDGLSDQSIFDTEKSGTELDKVGNQLQNAVRRLQHELGIPSPEHTTDAPPLFLAHGVQDEKVAIRLGREASVCLGGLGIPVCWHEYADLAHWYSGMELQDMIDALDL